VVIFSGEDIELGDHWLKAKGGAKTGTDTFITDDNALRLAFARETSGQTMSLSEYTETLRQEYQQLYTAVAAFDVPGKFGWKRLTVLGENRVDAFLIQKADGIYSITLSGRKQAFADKDADIRELLKLFE
jgi:hypothetical protein